ncbi:MAG TPA: hypothetical protein VHO49_12895 [Anaerolineales bacterium]|nr:hypothetical protein [Anaerolineales bacterium]
MNRVYHIQITTKALEKHFSPAALQKIVEANLYQDRLRGQIGHDEYHFDNNAFEASYSYIEKKRSLVRISLMADDPGTAWKAFGRLTHTAQDFYAHSNYIDLWLARQPEGTRPAPEQVHPMDPDLLHSPELRSGKVYLPWEVFTLVSFLEPTVKRLLPRDSHAWMNLDSPKQGYQFDYAVQAAVKRTGIEFSEITQVLTQSQLQSFLAK